MPTLRIKDENGNWQVVTSPESSGGGGGGQFKILADNIPMTNSGTNSKADIDISNFDMPMFLRFCMHFPYGDDSAGYDLYDMPFKCFMESEDEVMLTGDTKSDYSIGVLFIKPTNIIQLTLNNKNTPPASYITVYGYGY